MVLRNKIKHFLIGGGFVLLCLSFCRAGDEEIAPDNTTFVEIHVTPEGAYGVDSGGNEWQFDSDRGRFIREDDGIVSTKTVFGKKREKEASKALTSSEQAELEYEAKRMELEAKKFAQQARKIKGLRLGSVVVDVDEIINSSIVAVGPVTVKGQVNGNVVSYKRITVTSTGVINGNATAPEIVKSKGGIIRGNRMETDLPRIPEIELFRETSYTAFLVNVIILGALLISGLLAVAVISRPIGRLKACLESGFIRSFFIGLLIWFAIGPAIGLLSLTIIGIPIAAIGLPIALVLAIILGIVGLGQLAGEKVSRYFGGPRKSQLVQVVLGIGVLYAFWILMSLFMASPSSVSQGFATLFLVLAIVTWSIGVTSGLGAIVLTRFGSRDYRAGAPPKIRVETAPPPPPPSPPPLSQNGTNPPPPSPPQPPSGSDEN